LSSNVKPMTKMSSDQEDQDPFTLERTGCDAGLNPMFGEWQHTFLFAPVPYGDGGAKRAAFRAAMQSELSNKWIYSHNIQLEITLHLDVQTILETSETADLDNYAKAILDGLKGPEGIMLDDTQVQALVISWLDGYGKPSFTIETKASPDDFVIKPVEFYEMPDGLWYPHSRAVWSNGGEELLSDKAYFADLSIVELMSSVKKRARAEMRRAGYDRLRAFQRSRYVSLLARGFHRSRIAESGFSAHSLKEWQEARGVWKRNHPADGDQLDQILARLPDSYNNLIKVLAGRFQ